MSIIQRIRDKAAWLIFGAIALAMIGFIVTDAFQGGGGGLFNSRSTTLGKVNGTEIDYIDFQNRVKAQEDQMPGGMNDRQLADEALKLRPDLKVLFTTGYTRNAIVHNGRLALASN